MSNFRIYNETLCPELWDEYQHLDPIVRLNLLRMAYDFYKKTKLPAPIIDVYLMGSVANYNWTPDSDADVHVIIDYNKLQMPQETAFKSVKIASAQWNSEHEVTVKNHKVEMNIQNVHEVKPHVTGIYSLVKDQWVRKPFKQNVRIDKSIIQVQYQAMKKYIESAMNSRNRDIMKYAKEYVDAYRQYGLDTCGELSYQNIVFKILRAKGIIKKLKDSINIVYDKEMTVNEKMYVSFETNYGENPQSNKEMTVNEIFVDEIPNNNQNYIIIGITFQNGKTISGITTGHSGHGSLPYDEIKDKDYLNVLYWRYRKIDSVLYLAVSPQIYNIKRREQIVRRLYPLVRKYLREKYGIIPQESTVDMNRYQSFGHRVNENEIENIWKLTNAAWKAMEGKRKYIPAVKGQSGKFYYGENREQAINALKNAGDKMFLASSRGWVLRDNPTKFLTIFDIARIEMGIAVKENIELLKEGDAETITINGSMYDWIDSECIGPFIIFTDGKNSHYIFSNIRSDIVELDGEEVDAWGNYDTRTHGQLINIINREFPLLKLGRRDLKKAIQGRIWNVNGNIYVAVWNRDITFSDVPNIYDVFEKMIVDQTGVADGNKVFLQTTNDKFISYPTFKKQEDSIRVDVGKEVENDIKRKLHLMSPEEKRKALAAIGVKPKVGDVPDWKKRELAGVDESPQNEGYGAGDPKTDPLHIPGERWRIKFGSRKTSKIKSDEELINEVLVKLFKTENSKKDKLNESVVVGIIHDDDIISLSGGKHNDFRKSGYDVNNYKRWIWKLGSDEIVWWESPNLHEKELTADYIHKKYGKLIWKHRGGMEEDVSGTDINPPPRSTSVNRSDRINLFDQPGVLQNIHPLIKVIIKETERILDKKIKTGIKTFSIQYIDELLDDVININFSSSNVPKDHEIILDLKKLIVRYLQSDYYIK